MLPPICVYYIRKLYVKGEGQVKNIKNPPYRRGEGIMLKRLE